eukprot:scpid91623/ scgid25682/ 
MYMIVHVRVNGTINLIIITVVHVGGKVGVCMYMYVWSPDYTTQLARDLTEVDVTRTVNRGMSPEAQCRFTVAFAHTPHTATVVASEIVVPVFSLLGGANRRSVLAMPKVGNRLGITAILTFVTLVVYFAALINRVHSSSTAANATPAPV